MGTSSSNMAAMARISVSGLRTQGRSQVRSQVRRNGTSRVRCNRGALIVMAKESGTVKWFNSAKGYGFLTPNTGDTDVFVHQTAIHAEGFRSLLEGEEVEFDIVTDDDGKLRAIDVTGPGGVFVQGQPRRYRDD